MMCKKAGGILTYQDDFSEVKKVNSLGTAGMILLMLILGVIAVYGAYVYRKVSVIDKYDDVDSHLESINDHYESVRSSIVLQEEISKHQKYQIMDQGLNYRYLNSEILKSVANIDYEIILLKEYIDDRDILIYRNNNVLNDYIKNLTILNEGLKNSSNNIKNLGKYNDQLIDSINKGKLMHSNMVRTQKALTKSIVTDFVIFMNIIVVIITISYILLNRRIISPLKEIASDLREYAYNFKTRSFEIKEKDEIGYLLHNFNYLRSRIVAVEELNSQINQMDNFDSVFNYLFINFKSFIPYDRIGVAVLSEDKSEIIAYRAKSDYKLLLKDGYRAKLKKSSLYNVVQNNEPRIINDLSEYLTKNPNSDSTMTIIEEGMRSSATLPLNINGECIGVVFFSSIKKYAYNDSHINFLRTIAANLATIFDKSFMHDELIISTIEGFASLVESKDSDTGNHIERLKYYSVLIARLLKSEMIYNDIIDEEFIIQLSNFSSVHDIGKVSIPDRILLKPGKLNDDEFEIIKSHATIGGNILRKMDEKIHGNNRNFFKTGIEIAMHHHEKWNGSGYPSGLSGEDIPLSARIVAVADVFDALMSKRPYKDSFGLEKTFSIIEEGSGKHFDPNIVSVVLSNKNKMIEIYRMYSN